MATNSAIDAQRLNAFFVEPEKLTLVVDEEHALYDPRVHLPLNENLVLNIMAHGVREAIHLRKDGNTLLVAADRQRVKAAVEANKRIRKEGGEPVKIRAFVERGDDSEMVAVMVLENEFRLEDSPIVKARKALRYINTGKTEAEAATLYGVKVGTLKEWLSLLEAAAPVQKAVESGKVGAVAAATIAKLPKAEQAEALEALVAMGGGTTEARVAVAKRQGRDVVERPSLKDVRAVYDALKAAGKAEMEEHAKSYDALGATTATLAWVLGERKTPPSFVDHAEKIAAEKVAESKKKSSGSDK